MISTETGRYLDVAGLKTFFIQKGTGHPLVLVHGGSPGASARVNWGENVDFLAASGLTVYAYDQPGYGQTTRRTTAWSSAFSMPRDSSMPWAWTATS